MIDYNVNGGNDGTQVETVYVALTLHNANGDAVNIYATSLKNGEIVQFKRTFTDGTEPEINIGFDVIANSIFYVDYGNYPLERIIQTPTGVEAEIYNQQIFIVRNALEGSYEILGQI